MEIIDYVLTSVEQVIPQPRRHGGGSGGEVSQQRGETGTSKKKSELHKINDGVTCTAVLTGDSVARSVKNESRH